MRPGKFAEAWGAATPPADIVGLGPFVLKEYTPGQRLVFDRNPNYWRKAPDGQGLPYLDRVILEIVPDQNAELLRLQSGATDLTQDALRPDDYVPVKRLEQQGTLTMQEIGVATGCRRLLVLPQAGGTQKDPRWAFVQRTEFRQALSHAVDREAFAQTVFLGEAVPVWGPSRRATRVVLAQRAALSLRQAERPGAAGSIGLEDRNGNGIVEDARAPRRASRVITQHGLRWYERGTTVVREAGQGGRGVRRGAARDRAMVQRHAGLRLRRHLHAGAGPDLDPAANLDFWVSSG